MMQNPFSLSFGKEPLSLIDRDYQNREILDSFTAENPAYQVCMITGVRGAGKTVALTTIANDLRSRREWIVVDLNPEMDLLHQLAAELSNRRELFELFRDAKINLSFLGFGIEIDGEPPITDIVVALRRMLERICHSGKRVLITVDEASATPRFRAFASQFQIFIRENLNVFLLMTGLYENIAQLQNSKNLTFLYRAPKVDLKPLNALRCAQKYQEVFALPQEEAMSMAKETKGYPFAFQVLGYLCWVRKQPWQEVLLDFDAFLEEYVYEKIWSELSPKDQEVLFSMAVAEDGKVENIRRVKDLESNLFNIYRKRLLRSGLITAPAYGYVELALPRFREFILRNTWLE
ncbi:MAG: ATP-binding protein [Firmicutes bacterium]|nr:ATP-binding protein [Bacillota bacterium]